MDDNFTMAESSWGACRLPPRDVANPANPAAREQFQWQLPRPRPHTDRLEDRVRRDARSPMYDELDQELRTNEQRESNDGLADSVHTEFQEQTDNMPAPLEGVDEYDPPPKLYPGYMHSSSPFALETRGVNEMSFIEWFPKGTATLTYPSENDETGCVPNVNLWMIESRCPLLAAAFEDSRSGPKLHLETLTHDTIWPFLRYLYTDSYSLATPSGDYFEDVPTSVLLHCQLYWLADIYDLPNLKSQAYLNVLRQCEFGCSSPQKPIDLCDAIRYVYENLPNHEMLIDAILNYCVSCFLTHRLGDDVGFQALAYSLRPFHQALCRNSMAREFENETAAAIIQMPFCPYSPETYASRERPGSRVADVVYHFHSNEDVECLSKKRKQADFAPISQTSALSLALRPRQAPEELVAVGKDENCDGLPLKRRALSEVAADKPCPSELSDDEEYEIVPRPDAVEALDTDCEVGADDSGPVEVQHPTQPGLDEARSLPVRAKPVPRADDDSDSDWSIV